MPWHQLIAKAIPAHRRASASAIRNSLAAGFGFGAGLIVDRLLAAQPGLTGYAWLHLIAFALLVVSLGAVPQIREPETEGPERVRRSFWSKVRTMPEIWQGDHQFRRFLISIACSQTLFIMLPYLAIHALHVLAQVPQLFGAFCW